MHRMTIEADAEGRPLLRITPLQWYRCDRCNLPSSHFGDGACPYALDATTTDVSEEPCPGRLVPAAAPADVSALRCCSRCRRFHVCAGDLCGDCVATEVAMSGVDDASGDELWPLLELDLGGEG